MVGIIADNGGVLRWISRSIYSVGVLSVIRSGCGILSSIFLVGLSRNNVVSVDQIGAYGGALLTWLAWLESLATVNVYVISSGSVVL